MGGPLNILTLILYDKTENFMRKTFNKILKICIDYRFVGHLIQKREI